MPVWADWVESAVRVGSPVQLEILATAETAAVSSVVTWGGADPVALEVRAVPGETQETPRGQVATPEHLAQLAGIRLGKGRQVVATMGITKPVAAMLRPAAPTGIMFGFTAITLTKTNLSIFASRSQFGRITQYP
jgi:hypothetical protein